MMATLADMAKPVILNQLSWADQLLVTFASLWSLGRQLLHLWAASAVLCLPPSWWLQGGHSRLLPPRAGRRSSALVRPGRLTAQVSWWPGAREEDLASRSHLLESLSSHTWAQWLGEEFQEIPRQCFPPRTTANVSQIPGDASDVGNCNTEG